VVVSSKLDSGRPVLAASMDTMKFDPPTFVVPGAEQIFIQHGCEATIECT
jgi:hypothetical protein